MTSFSINPLPGYVEDKAGAPWGLPSTESGLLLLVRFDAGFPTRGDLSVADDGRPADPTVQDPGIIRSGRNFSATWRSSSSSRASHTMRIPPPSRIFTSV